MSVLWVVGLSREWVWSGVSAWADIVAPEEGVGLRGSDGVSGAGYVVVSMWWSGPLVSKGHPGLHSELVWRLEEGSLLLGRQAGRFLCNSPGTLSSLAVRAL